MFIQINYRVFTLGENLKLAVSGLAFLMLMSNLQEVLIVSDEIFNLNDHS